MRIEQSETAVILEDEALRDGLQMESQIFSLEDKSRLFELLQKAGVPRIQVGSFVHPKIVPQMANTDDLIKTIQPRQETTVTALILNDKGLERALNCGVPHVSMSISVSDTHSRKNAKMPTQEALGKMEGLIREALSSGLEVRAGLQSAFGCVYEGKIEKKAVLSAAERLMATGVREVNLADSTGMANPNMIRDMVSTFKKEFPQVNISLHLHDTRGLGLANMLAGYEAGARTFDVCAGGLGGCPFIKGAAGNVPTEDAVHMFESMGIPTGIDLAGVTEVVELLEKQLGRTLPGRMTQVIKSRVNCE